MIGTILSNRYKLEEKIGVGGTAVVYKAKDTVLNRNVAVKVLKSELSDDDDFVAKFKREATSVASISDINIVNIYDVGTDEKINYIVMEYIDGKTLKEIIKQEKTIDTKRIITIAIQITKALDCAHRNSIIHRDIKPHNIMVTKDGIVKVTDFGIAKASNSVTITSTNKVVGSAHYLSPEQAQGKQVDCRTDIYSFGIVLYEMATGKVPHDADSPVSVALKHIQEPVVPPKELNENIPAALNRLILKCLEKDPNNRYQNARQILNDFIRMKNNYRIDDFDETMTVDDDEDYTKVMEPVKAKGLEKSIKKNKNDYEDDEDVDAEEMEEEEEPKDSKANKKKKIIAASIIGVILLAGCVLFFALGAGLLSSNAAAKVRVPKIDGLKEGDAKKAVTDAKLKFEVVQRTKSDKPVGTVIACSPNENTEVDEGTTIRVDISAGQEASSVPTLFMMKESEAKDEIVKDGFTVGNIDRRNDPTVPKGCVIDQSPEGGSSLEKGKPIDFSISTGPSESDTVSVPSVVNSSEGDASSALKAAGFNVAVSTKATDDSTKDGTVSSQNPPAGTKVAKGSTITIVVLKYNSVAQTNNNTSNNKANSNQSNNNSTATQQQGSTNQPSSGGQSSTPGGNTAQPGGSTNTTTGSNNNQSGSNNQNNSSDKK